MITKGPLARVTINVVVVTLLVCTSIALFALVSIRRDNKRVDDMIADVPAIIELYNLINDYPTLNVVDYTQDGELTLLDSSQNEIANFSINNEQQIEALRNLEKIYRDDNGLIFSYGSNFLSTVPRVVFSGKSMEDLKNKKSDNETVTKITNGVYMIVYRFDYERFFSAEEIKYQLEGLYESILIGAEGILVDDAEQA